MFINNQDYFNGIPNIPAFDEHPFSDDSLVDLARKIIAASPKGEPRHADHLIQSMKDQLKKLEGDNGFFAKIVRFFQVWYHGDRITQAAHKIAMGNRMLRDMSNFKIYY